MFVPARAITTAAGVSTVQVLKDGGATEVRTVKTGLTDGQNTEITDGLTEGEKIVSLAKSTASSTTTPAGGIRLPGGIIR